MALRRYFADPELRRGEVAAWGRHLHAAGWRRTHDDDWNLYLARGRPSDRFYRELRLDQWVNRFPGMAAYAVKSFLAANLGWAAAGVRRRTGSPGGFDFVPETFLLPDGASDWRARTETTPEAWWLLKPLASSRGRGIRLLEPGEAPPSDGDWLIQRYIDRPHLIDGHKYGLRYYVLVTSLDPLLAYVHRVGTCRVATRPFAMDGQARADPLVHLINTAIQQGNLETPWWQRNLGLDGYYQRIAGEGHPSEPFEAVVHDLLARTLIACRDQALVESRAATRNLPGCFEFLAVDLQVDDSLKPWLLECNPAPPMEDEGGFDARTGALFGGIKDALMEDTLSLLGAAMESSGSRDQGPWSAQQWNVRAAAERTGARGWQRLYPRSDAARFVGDFPRLRPRDRSLALSVGVHLEPAAPLRPAADVASLPLGDGLVLHQGRTGRLFATNAIAAYLWAGLAEGVDVGDLVQEIAAVRPDLDESSLREEMEDLLGTWAQLGLLSGFEAGVEPFERGRLRVLGRLEEATLWVWMAETPESRREKIGRGFGLPSTEVERVVLRYGGSDGAPVGRSIAPTAGLDALALRSTVELRLSATEAADLVAWAGATRFIEMT